MDRSFEIWNLNFYLIHRETTVLIPLSAFRDSFASVGLLWITLKKRSESNNLDEDQSPSNEREYTVSVFHLRNVDVYLVF